MTLRSHGVVLRTERLVLRPMAEDDWPTLLRWNRDPDVLRYWDPPEPEPWTLEKLEEVYRSISEDALMFLAEMDGRPIAECWLQRMNLPRILERHAGEDVRRIDLSIGEKDLWGRGLGTEIVRALVALGFERERCDRICVTVSRANMRSRRAFEKAGLAIVGEVHDAPDERDGFDLEITRAAYEGRRG